MSSNILEYHKDDPPHKNYMSFISLCLLASLFADTFLQGIYAKVFSDFSEKVAVIKTSVEDSNKKSDYILNTLKEQKNKKRQSVSRDAKKMAISKIARAHKLTRKEAEILYKIQNEVTITQERLYEKRKKGEVNNSLKKLQKKNLIRKVSLNNSFVFIPDLSFRTID